MPTILPQLGGEVNRKKTENHDQHRSQTAV
nr:MAG TPA: hypothetical protein [Caudoviricetes sp.]